MSVTTASIGLADGLKTAGSLWEEARAGWDDPVSRAFEENYWLPLKSQVESTLAALDRLGPILARAREECS
ncbi:MAG: hypothetical protein ACYC3I_22995 [Gemmataceae bacterium]